MKTLILLITFFVSLHVNANDTLRLSTPVDNVVDVSDKTETRYYVKIADNYYRVSYEDYKSFKAYFERQIPVHAYAVVDEKRKLIKVIYLK